MISTQKFLVLYPTKSLQIQSKRKASGCHRLMQQARSASLPNRVERCKQRPVCVEKMTCGKETAVGIGPLAHLIGSCISPCLLSGNQYPGNYPCKRPRASVLCSTANAARVLVRLASSQLYEECAWIPLSATGATGLTDCTSCRSNQYLCSRSSSRSSTTSGT